MKKGWQTKTLGELCSFENGDRGENYPSKSVQTTSGVPFINAGHLSESGIDFSDMNYIPRERFELLGNGKIRKDDILFCLRGSLGKFASVGDLSEGAIASSLVIIRPSDAILNEFVLAYLQSDLCAEMIQEFRNGAAQPNLAAASLKKFSIPVPPLAEQQRIVGLLDEAFDGLATAKANAEKNIQNARALFESHLQSVFTQRGPGWVEKPFEDCIEHVKYTAKIQRKEFLEEGEFPIVSQEAEFTNGYWDNAADVFKVTSPVVIFGDHTQVLKYIDFDFVLGADGVKLLPPKPFLNPKFFFYALRSAPLKSLGYARHYRLLKELQIGYPDTNAQVAIAKKLDALEAETQRLTRLYERKHAALEALKKSLLHQAFTGAL